MTSEVILYFMKICVFKMLAIMEILTKSVHTYEYAKKKKAKFSGVTDFFLGRYRRTYVIIINKDSCWDIEDT